MFDDDVPMPSRQGRNKYTLAGIQVGQSKWIEFDPEVIESLAQLRSSVVTSAKYQNRTIPDIKFSTSRETRQGKDGVRIWRVQ